MQFLKFFSIFFSVFFFFPDIANCTKSPKKSGHCQNLLNNKHFEKIPDKKMSENDTSISSSNADLFALKHTHKNQMFLNCQNLFDELTRQIQEMQKEITLLEAKFVCDHSTFELLVNLFDKYLSLVNNYRLFQTVNSFHQKTNKMSICLNADPYKKINNPQSNKKICEKKKGFGINLQIFSVKKSLQENLNKQLHLLILLTSNLSPYFLGYYDDQSSEVSKNQTEDISNTSLIVEIASNKLLEILGGMNIFKQDNDLREQICSGSVPLSVKDINFDINLQALRNFIAELYMLGCIWNKVFEKFFKAQNLYKKLQKSNASCEEIGSCILKLQSVSSFITSFNEKCDSAKEGFGKIFHN